MRKNRRFAYMALLLALPLVPLFGEESLKLRIVPSPNLIKNPGFVHVDGDGLPLEWTFDNCSKSRHFKSQVVRHQDGNCLAVDAAWCEFGYWMQTIPLKKGASYYVSCDAQSDGPNVMIWIQCKQGKKVAGKDVFRKEFRARSFFRNGLAMRNALQDFVDETLLTPLGPNQWSRVGCEVVLPKNVDGCRCEVRIGVYSGSTGQIRLRNPVFREMKSELKAEIIGTGWTELRILGAKPASVKLDPAQATQSCSFVLPRAMYLYKVELIGSQGKTITKEITNE